MQPTIATAVGAVAVIALAASVPLAAGENGGVPDCPPGQEEEIRQEIGHIGEKYHLNLASENVTKLGVWREVNKWPGLQTEPGSCNDFGDIRHYPADAPVAAVAAAGLT